MRKLFRFKYEPCNKTCYAYCSKLMTELRALSRNCRESLVAKMVKAHGHLCDNPAYSLGLDVEEAMNVFVAHLRTPEKTELFCGREFENVVLSVCEATLLEKIPNSPSGECRYGDNGAENLGREILKFCTDAGYAMIANSHCECKSHAPVASLQDVRRFAGCAAQTEEPQN